MARYGSCLMAMARPRAWPARCWRRRRQARTGSTSPRSKASPAHARFRRASRARGEHRLHVAATFTCVRRPAAAMGNLSRARAGGPGRTVERFRRAGARLGRRDQDPCEATSTSTSAHREGACQGRSCTRCSHGCGNSSACRRGHAGTSTSIDRTRRPGGGRLAVRSRSGCAEITAAVERLLPAT